MKEKQALPLNLTENRLKWLASIGTAFGLLSVLKTPKIVLFILGNIFFFLHLYIAEQIIPGWWWLVYVGGTFFLAFTLLTITCYTISWYYTRPQKNPS